MKTTLQWVGKANIFNTFADVFQWAMTFSERSPLYERTTTDPFDVQPISFDSVGSGDCATDAVNVTCLF